MTSKRLVGSSIVKTWENSPYHCACGCLKVVWSSSMLMAATFGVYARGHCPEYDMADGSEKKLSKTWFQRVIAAWED
jgi:hypothetical protein